MPDKRWIVAMGKVGRVVAARIEQGEDAFNSIVELIKESGFKSGTVHGIGSSSSATIQGRKVMDFTRPLEEGRVTYTMEGPVALGFCWGMFGTEEDGNVFLHLHAIIMDKKGHMCCGNLQPGSTPIMVTFDVTIQELIGLEIKPTLDPVLNHKLFNPANVS